MDALLLGNLLGVRINNHVTPTRFEGGIEILDEKILYQNGAYKRIKKWLRGIHPELGQVTWGWTGWETVIEKDVIKALHTYENTFNRL
jgi:hypothetical protein